jgi:hypothetical protein
VLNFKWYYNSLIVNILLWILAAPY